MKAFGVFYRGELKKPGPYVARLQETDYRPSSIISATTVTSAPPRSIAT